MKGANWFGWRYNGLTHQVSKNARQVSNTTAQNDWEYTVLSIFSGVVSSQFNLRIFFLKVLETLCYGLDAKYLSQDHVFDPQLVVLFQKIAECMRGVS